MTDYHVITPEVDELVMQVIDGQLIIVPPATTESEPSVAERAKLPLEQSDRVP